MLIAFTGLPGTGKTTIARVLAQRLGAMHLRIDTIEQALAAGGDVPDVGATGYLVAYEVAADNLRRGLSVIADCVNPVAARRQRWADVAGGARPGWRRVDLVCPDAAEHRRRLATRTSDIAGHVLPSWEAVKAMRFDPVPPEALVIDTATLDVHGAAELVAQRVAAAGGQGGAAAGRPGAPRRLETARLVLRPWTLADHPAYARICADPRVMRYVGAGTPNPPEVTWRSMAGMLGHWDLLGYGIWALALRDGGLVGHVGYIDVPGWPGFELAWLLGREHWGRGYAREAAGAALRVAFDGLGRERVISLIRPANAPSIRLAQALGAVREGTTSLLGGPAEVFVHRRPAG